MSGRQWDIGEAEANDIVRQADEEKRQEQTEDES